MDGSVLQAWIVAYIAVVGACIGSFLNVVVARLPLEMSVVRPRSHCPDCEQPIAWYDNIPILSWCLLRGRCRRCGMRIAVRYPLVELLMAALAVAIWYRFGWSGEFFLWLPLTAALMAITFLDIDHWWVPDVITYPAMALLVLAAFFPVGLTPLEAALGLLPAMALWGIGWVFARLTGRDGLGFGDIKLLAVIGLAVGAIQAQVILFLAAVQGSVIGLLVMLTGGHGQHTEEATPSKEVAEGNAAGEQDTWTPPPRAIPFGPFLVLATLQVVLLPEVFGNLPERLVRLFLSP